MSWDPWERLRANHPDVEVYEIELRNGALACADVRRRTIWLDSRQTDAQKRCGLAFELAVLERGPMPDDPLLAAALDASARDWAAQMLIEGDELAAAFRLSTDLAFVAAWLEVDVPTLRERLRGMSDTEQDAWLEAVREVSER